MQQIEEILIGAVRAGASDVHITAGSAPRMRQNGNLLTMPYKILTAEDIWEFAQNIMNEEQLQCLRERGESGMSLPIPDNGRCRVSVFKQQGRVAMAFRLIAAQVPSAEELGLPESVVDLCQIKQGLIFVTGNAGSGRSTTLAAMIDKVNRCRNAHVITLEDPIEYIHQHKMSIVNQREVGQDTPGYADALRAAQREDPDVILVGEMRDYETVSTAITAAETGHLVLSAFHTAGAVNSIERMIDMFPPYERRQVRMRLSEVLEAVIYQQLLPRADGRGRVAAFEELHMNPVIRRLIREEKISQISGIMQINRRLGMTYMSDTIAMLLREGKITWEMAAAFTREPNF